MQPINRLSLLLSLLFFSVGVKSQRKEIELDPVTITATLSPVSASKTGRNIIIIKGERFNQLPIHSIDELLRYLPGLEVQARGPMGSQSNILIRGGTFQQVLVVLDGIRLNDPLTGHFNSYIPISAAEIERIEILKGASSAVYGTEAVGGVVHIISKTFHASQKNKTKQIQAQTSAGQYGLWSFNGGGFMPFRNGAFSGGIVTNNADGPQQRGTNGFFHNSTFSGSVKYWINPKWSVAFRTAYDTRDFSAQNFFTSFISDTAQERVNTWWNHLKVSYENGKHRFSMDAGYKKADDRYQFRKGVTPNQNKSTLFQALGIYDYSIREKVTITTGFQYQQKSIRSNDRGNHSINYAGAFVLLQHQLWNSLQLNPAVRFDYNDRAGWEIIPQLNLSYRYKNFTARGSIGKSTRDADFTERFNNYNKPLVTSGSIGNPDLLSERSFSYEAGVDYLAGSRFKIASTYFRKEYSRLIDFVITPYADMPRKDNLVPTGNYLLAKNISEVNTEGFEIDIQYNTVTGTDQELWVTCGLLWLTSKTKGGGTPSLYISSHADFLTNFNVSYKYRFFQLSLNGLYKRRPAQSGNPILAPLSADYFVMNARLDGFIIKKKLSLYIQADNVFDRSYADRFGVPMPGSWWLGGLKCNF